MTRTAPGFAVLAGTFPGVDAIPAEQFLHRAADAGYGALSFPTPAHLDPAQSRERLAELGGLARDLGLELYFGVGTVGPAGDDEPVLAKIRERLSQGLTAGCTSFLTFTETVFTGVFDDRRSQLDTVIRRLRALTPVLAELGCRLDVKTHEDVSSHELLDVIRQVDSPLIGVCLDVANLVVRGEDPVRAAELLAPHTAQAHLEDVLLPFTARGAHRYLMPCGSGALDWTSILRVLGACELRHIVLEQHQGDFEIPFFEASWIDEQGDLSTHDLSAIAAMAWRSEQILGDGTATVRSPKRTRHWDEVTELFAQSRTFLEACLSLG